MVLRKKQAWVEQKYNMRFHDLYPLKEGFYSDLIVTVQDLLLMAMSRGDTEISTEEFKRRLAREGFRITTDQLVQAVDQSNFATSVDRDKIVPKSQLPDQLKAASPEDAASKVSDLAQQQASKDLK